MPIRTPLALAAAALAVFLQLLPAGPARAQVVEVPGPVLFDTTWGDDEDEVVLRDPVVVRAGATLTLVNGVIVRGEPVTAAGDAPGALVIARGAKIVANGDPSQPFYMTTGAVDNDVDGEADDTDADGFPDPWQPGDRFLDDDPTAGPAPEKPVWLGLWVLGEAPVELGCTGFEEGQIEQLTDAGVSAQDASFGGANPADDSGVLTGVRVRTAGQDVGCCQGVVSGDGITLAGVGDQTVFQQNDFVSECWRGFADLHAHPMTHLGFGHRESSGSCTEREGLFHGLPGGTLNLADRDAGMEQDLANCDPEVHSPCINLSVVQRITRQTILAVLENRFPNHGPSGARDFRHWPHAQSRTHQQMHVKWLRQAYEGGMRVMIASVTESEVLEKWYHYAVPGPDCDVFTPDPSFLYASALEQIAAIQQLVADNPDWLHLADTPEDALDAAFPLAGPGKLVLILGLEMDALSLADTLDLVDNHGVRSVIPIHLVNNGFGGAAVYDDLFNTLNHWQEGDYFQLVRDPTLTFQLGEAEHLNAYQPIPVFGGQCAIEPRRELEVDPSFTYTLQTCALDPSLGQRNARGISDFEGLFALMQRGVLLDLTHMGWASKTDSLTYAEAVAGLSPWGGYPVIDSHTGLRDEGAPVDPGDPDKVSERDLTWSHAQRIRALGGVIGFGTVGDPPRTEIAAGPGRYEAGREIGQELLIRLTGEGKEYIAFPEATDARDPNDEIHELRVRLRTGGDNLEGGSTARVLLDVSGTVHELALKDPGPTWDDYSIHDVTLTETIGAVPLQTLGIKVGDLTGVGLRLLGSDDWNVDRFDVTYTGVDAGNNPTGGLLVERFGTYWQRLNGPDDQVLTPPSDWRPKSQALADHRIDSIYFEWNTDKTGPLDPNMLLILNLHDGTKREIAMSALDGLVGDPDGGGLAHGTWNLLAGGGSPVTYQDVETLVAMGTGQSETFGYGIEVRRITVEFTGCTDATCTTPVADVPMIDDSDATARGHEPFFLRDDRQTALLWRGLPHQPTLAPTTPLKHLGVELEVGADGLEFDTPTFLDLDLKDGRVIPLEVTTTETKGLAPRARLTFQLHLTENDVTTGDVVAVRYRAPTFSTGMSDNLDVTRLDVYRLGDPMGRWLAGFNEANLVMGGDPSNPANGYDPGWVALGTDFNGLSPQMGYMERVQPQDEGTPLLLPAPYTGVERGDTSLDRTFSIEDDGLAHYGLLKDFAEEVFIRDALAADSLYQSGPRTLEAWKRAGEVGASLAGLPAPVGTTAAACGLPACSDGTDNDGDGLLDFPADPGCVDGNDVSEVPEPGFVVGLVAGLVMLRVLARRRPRAT